MLPPVDPTVFERNPSFETLYKDLCTRKLNPDGSTRDTKKQRGRDEVRRELTTAQTNNLKSQILLRTLSDLPSKSDTLPPELHSVIEIITAQLSGHIPSASDREILSADTATFTSNIDIIADAISAQLVKISSLLSTIADPLNPCKTEDLPAIAAQLQEKAVHDLPEEIGTARVQVANSAYQVLSTYRTLLETSIRILEQTQHGALARAAKSKAELLHTRATVLGLQARIHTHTHPPPAEFVAALRQLKASQGASERELRDREALAKRELELYARAGERIMRDIAKRKGVLRAEIGRMADEVRKLERG